MRSLGLRERIARAETEEEISAMLKEGSAYEFASARTRRSWRLTANKKFGSFVAPVAEQKMTAPRKKKKKVVASTT